MMEYYAAHADVPGVRQMSERDKRVTVLVPTDQIRMTMESEPLTPAGWLADVLSEVVTTLENVDYGKASSRVSRRCLTQLRRRFLYSKGA